MVGRGKTSVNAEGRRDRGLGGVKWGFLNLKG